MTTPEKIRLSKLMSQRGLCSRREADRYIEQGLVYVDGQILDTLGAKVDPGADVTLSSAAQTRQRNLVTVLLNKPVGYVSGQAEPGYRPAASLLRPRNRFRAPSSKVDLSGLAPAGRLDIDSQGLLVFTQDGRIARLLIGENSAVEKEYLVRYQGRLTPEILKLLNHGLRLDDKALRPARVTELNQDQLKFILRQGRKRQIRRMCEQVGLTAIGLKRVRIGRVHLGNLPEGRWRMLEPHEKF